MSVIKEVLYFVENLKPKDHVIIFYFDPEIKYNILLSYPVSPQGDLCDILDRINV